MIDLLFTIRWFLIGGGASFLIWKMENGEEFNLIHLFYCILGIVFAPLAILFVIIAFLFERQDRFNIPTLWEKKYK